MSDVMAMATRRFVTALGLALALAAPAVAQTEGPALRFPAEGPPILDCDPAAPMPADSCVLRVPPRHQRIKIVGDGIDGSEPTFEFATRAAELPEGIVLSRSMVLIDLSPGANGGRKATWARERAMIAGVLRALPEGEQVALYGFNENLERLADFTDDRAALAGLVDQLELRGANTRIATNVRDAIDILGDQTGAIVRDLIVISDGREEGRRDPAEVARMAIDKGVTVSGLAMLWGPVGAPENGAGLDYLQMLGEGTLGETRGIQLRGAPEEEAQVTAFIEGIAAAHRGSGLILPRGEAIAADITVVMNRPLPGQPGAFSEAQAKARFLPAATRHGPAPAEAPEAAAETRAGWLSDSWMGVRILWWVVGASVATLALGLAITLALSRRRPGEELPPEAAGEATGWAGPADAGQAEALPGVRAPAGPPLAYLVRDDTGSRVTIRAPRVTIGRSSTCDIEIADGSISRLHAELEQRRDGSFQLSDAGSLNGTLLNGRKLDGPQQIRPGDILTLGKVPLRFSKA